MYIKRLWMFLLWLLGWHAVHAQCSVENRAMMAGERLTYELHFNWKFMWVKAGVAEFHTSATTYHALPALRTVLELKGNKRSDFFFTLRDTLENIMSEDLIPYRFSKHAEEGNHYTQDEIAFSYADGQTHIRQSRLRRERELRYAESTESRCVYDMLSLLAVARSFDMSTLEVGQRLTYPMATGTKVEEQTLIYRKKVNFKAANGATYRCLVFSLVKQSKGAEKEVITFYVTDDDNRLPVRLDLFLNFGSAKAYLTEISGNRHPLSAIVEGE